MNIKNLEEEIETLAQAFDDQMTTINPFFLSMNEIKKSLEVYILISKYIEKKEVELYLLNDIDYLFFKLKFLELQKNILNELNIEYSQQDKGYILIVLKIIEKKRLKNVQNFLSLTGFGNN